MLFLALGLLLGLSPDIYEYISSIRTKSSLPGEVVAAQKATAAMNRAQTTEATATTIAIASVATPASTSPATATATSTPLPTATPSPERSSRIVHRVGAGETLIAIAERYGTTVEMLMELNGLQDPNVIKEGQEIIVEPSLATRVTSTPSTPTPQPRYIIHRVQPGETLKSIAERYGTTPEVLAAYNGLHNPDLLKEGQEIAIPQ